MKMQLCQVIVAVVTAGFPVMGSCDGVRSHDVCIDGWTTQRGSDGSLEKSELWRPDPKLELELLQMIGKKVEVLCWHRLPSEDLILIEGSSAHRFLKGDGEFRYVGSELIVHLE